MKHVDVECQDRLWRSLPDEERNLRVVLAWFSWSRLHRECLAYANAHRPLHVTALWDNARFGFALKLEGLFEGVWFVRLAGNSVLDLVYMPFVCKERSRSVLARTEGDDCLRNEWLGAVQAFLEYRGVLPDEPVEIE
jgi:hypothetical protein